MRTLWLLVLVLLLSPTVAFADGGFFKQAPLPGRVAGAGEVSSASQKAIVIREGDSEVLLLQTTYGGPAAEFAWVIPVPGRPTATDVFPASTEFVDAIFLATQPTIQTHIVDPLRRYGRGMKAGLQAPAAPPGGLPGAPERVTVWERMEVGDYDAAVLSATSAAILVEWLNENGFVFPPEAEEIAAGYVQKQWYFVALRIRPGLQQEQPVLQDVEPIGIRFPAERLTYPLGISAVSAPEKTSLLLAVLADAPVTCNELIVMEPEVKTERPPGSCYTSVVKELLDRGNGEALFCEYRGAVDTNRYGQMIHRALRSVRSTDEDAWKMGQLDLTEMSYDASEIDPAAPRDWSQLQATRFFGLLPKVALLDLTFSPARQDAIVVHVTRRATLPVPRWAQISGSPLFVVTLHVILFALLLVGFQRLLRRPRAAADQAPELDRTAMLTFSILVGILLSLAVGLLTLNAIDWEVAQALAAALVGAEDTGDYALLILQLLYCLVAWWAASKLIRGASAGQWARAMVLTIVFGGVFTWLFSELFFIDPDDFASPHLAMSLLTLWALACAASALIVRSPLGSARAHLPGDAILFALVSTAVLSPFLMKTHNAVLETRPSRYEITQQLDEALQELDEALGAFKDQTGCYPERLLDLTKTQSTYGLDSSGNRVPLTSPLQTAVLQELPTDPLTGRSDTWVYDVLAPQVVDSGAYEIMVERSSP